MHNPPNTLAALPCVDMRLRVSVEHVRRLVRTKTVSVCAYVRACASACVYVFRARVQGAGGERGGWVVRLRAGVRVGGCGGGVGRRAVAVAVCVIPSHARAERLHCMLSQSRRGRNLRQTAGRRGRPTYKRQRVSYTHTHTSNPRATTT